jgi:hypothetical protein
LGGKEIGILGRVADLNCGGFLRQVSQYPCVGVVLPADDEAMANLEKFITVGPVFVNDTGVAELPQGELFPPPPNITGVVYGHGIIFAGIYLNNVRETGDLYRR